MQSEILWLPDDSGAESLLMLDIPIGATDSDLRGMIQMNEAGMSFLNGQLDTGTYLDTLDQYGVDPERFLRLAEEKIGLK